jgi:hypothetical protein
MLYRCSNEDGGERLLSCELHSSNPSGLPGARQLAVSQFRISTLAHAAQSAMQHMAAQSAFAQILKTSTSSAHEIVTDAAVALGLTCTCLNFGLTPVTRPRITSVIDPRMPGSVNLLAYTWLARQPPSHILLVVMCLEYRARRVGTAHGQPVRPRISHLRLMTRRSFRVTSSRVVSTRVGRHSSSVASRCRQSAGTQRQWLPTPHTHTRHSHAPLWPAALQRTSSTTPAYRCPSPARCRLSSGMCSSCSSLTAGMTLTCWLWESHLHPRARKSALVTERTQVL